MSTRCHLLQPSAWLKFLFLYFLFQPNISKFACSIIYTCEWFQFDEWMVDMGEVWFSKFVILVSHKSYGHLMKSLINNFDGFILVWFWKIRVWMMPIKPLIIIAWLDADLHMTLSMGRSVATSIPLFILFLWIFYFSATLWETLVTISWKSLC